MSSQKTFDLKRLTEDPPKDKKEVFDRILGATRVLFTAHGWSGTRIAMVVDASHASYDDVIGLFSSKQELAVMTYRQPLGNLIAAAQLSAPDEDFTRFVFQLVRLLVTLPVLSTMLLPSE